MDLHRLGDANYQTASFLLRLHIRRMLETYTSDQYFDWWCSAFVVGLYMIVVVGIPVSLDVDLLIEEHIPTWPFHHITFQRVTCSVQFIQYRLNDSSVFGNVVTHDTSVLAALQIQRQRMLDEQATGIRIFGYNLTG